MLDTKGPEIRTGKLESGDEKVVIEVPSTGITDTHIIEIAGALFVLGGIGVIVYVKKKKQK